MDLPQGRLTGNAMHQSPRMEETHAEGTITQLSLVSNTVKVTGFFFSYTATDADDGGLWEDILRNREDWGTMSPGAQ